MKCIASTIRDGDWTTNQTDSLALSPSVECGVSWFIINYAWVGFFWAYQIQRYCNRYELKEWLTTTNTANVTGSTMTFIAFSQLWMGERNTFPQKSLQKLLIWCGRVCWKQLKCEKRMLNLISIGIYIYMLSLYN